MNKLVTQSNQVQALDVANYLICLSQMIGEPLTNMKLQKLLYYCYAWYLVDNNNSQALFDETIEAWKYGPVVRNVYFVYEFHGADNIKMPVDTEKNELNVNEEEKRLEGLLSDEAKDVIKEVFSEYGNSTAIELMKLSHMELPWNSTYKDGQMLPIERDLIFSYFKQQKNQSIASHE